MKRLVEQGVRSPQEGRGLSDRLAAMVAHDATADRTFVLDEHEVKEWIIAGKLERVLEGFLAGHDLPSKKVSKGAGDLTFKLEDGLSLRVRQVPREESPVDTGKYVLSVAVQGIDVRNADKARRLFDDLEGIPV